MKDSNGSPGEGTQSNADSKTVFPRQTAEAAVRHGGAVQLRLCDEWLTELLANKVGTSEQRLLVRFVQTVALST